MNRRLVTCFLLLASTVLWIGASPAMGASLIVNHYAAANFDRLSAQSFENVRSFYSIFYGHTSHGSQLISGMKMLGNENPDRYHQPAIAEKTGMDLGSSNWDSYTRQFLNGNPNVNLVMWSWCTQLSSASDATVNRYLSKMSQLESDYPNVIFVYMTGHLDGTGTSGRLYHNNNLIRSYCTRNKKVLYDFADIESYDPNGNYYEYDSDTCQWCTAWCRQHDCPRCNYCAHSHCFNCYQKGKAFWWMLASLTGSASDSPQSSDSSDSGSGCFITSTSR